MEQEKIMTIHCASCGAPAQYDIVKQNYHCPNCGEDTGTEIPLKKLREFRSLTKTLLEQELPDSQTIACECPNCGARVIVKEHEVTETCIFCQSKILRSNVQMREGFPEMVIPFRLNRKQAEKQLDEWVEKHSDKKESEILKENRKKLKGIYLPYELIRGPIRFNVARDNSDRRYTCGGFLEHVAVNVTERCNNLLLNGMEPFLWEDLEPFQFGYIAGHAAEVPTADGEELKSPNPVPGRANPTGNILEFDDLTGAAPKGASGYSVNTQEEVKTDDGWTLALDAMVEAHEPGSNGQLAQFVFAPDAGHHWMAYCFSRKHVAFEISYAG